MINIGPIYMFFVRLGNSLAWNLRARDVGDSFMSSAPQLLRTPADSPLRCFGLGPM